MSAPAAPPQNLAERLRTVKVGVRPEIEVSRHIFNGEPAYVVRDPITFQTHKLSPSDYQVFIAINANDELKAIFAKLCSSEVLEQDQEEQFYQFVLSLTQFGLLILPVSDGAALYGRYTRRQASELRAKITGFLFLRVPLVQPDAFLERTMHLFAPLFTKTSDGGHLRARLHNAIIRLSQIEILAACACHQ